MAHGIEVFRDYFSDYHAQYTLIGGMACDLLLSDAGIDFRQTRDMDMVLIVEALSNDFLNRFWKFIHDGGYEVWTRRDGKPMFYRFVKPKQTGFPYMIELFSRPGNTFDFSIKGHLFPLYFDDDISSLSAILLNDDYYSFLQSGMTISEGISVPDAPYLAALKMRAWIDLMEQRTNGFHVDERDIRKHRLDVFRLFPLINPDKKITAPSMVYDDIQLFIKKMRETTIDIQSLHLKNDKEFILDVYQSIYING